MIVCLVVQKDFNINSPAVVTQDDRYFNPNPTATLASATFRKIERHVHLITNPRPALPGFMGHNTLCFYRCGSQPPLFSGGRVVILIPIIRSLFQHQNAVIADVAFFVIQTQRSVVVNGYLPERIFQHFCSRCFWRNVISRLPLRYVQCAITHRRYNLLDLDIKLHKRFVVTVMHDLPVYQTRIDFANTANKKGNGISPIVTQAKLMTSKADRCVNHLFTRPRHQVKQHQFIAVAERHVVRDFAQIKTDQVIRHILRQFEARDDFPVNLIAAATSNAVVSMIF